MGLRAYFLNPISCPPALGYGERGQGLYRFLNRVRLPRVRSELVWLGLCRRQMSCGTNDLSTFELISSSSFNFFREHPLTVCIVFFLLLNLFPSLRVRASFFLKIVYPFVQNLFWCFCNTLLGVVPFILFLGPVCLSPSLPF